tara:strand:- start:4000 stop:4140 length:141 start_codon:yes stop_codon:yes gene_type:complete
MSWLKRHPLAWIVALVLVAAAALYISRLAKAEATTGDTPLDYQPVG